MDFLKILIFWRIKCVKNIETHWGHKLIYIALIVCKHACKVDCDVNSGIDPLPFSLGLGQKMLGFSQVLKPIKWQDLLEEGKKMGVMRFEQVQRFNLAKTIFWG